MSKKKLAIWRSVKITGDTFEKKLAASVNNTGNMLFQRAVINQLDYDLIIDGDISAVDEDVEWLVLTLANFINPYNNMESLANSLEKSKVENINLIGVGAQSNSYDSTLHIPKDVMRILKIASERSKSIGVRGYYTAELLNARGIKNVDVIGCPSVFEHPQFNPIHREQSLDKSRISVHTTPSGNFRDTNAALFSFGVKYSADYVLQNEPELRAFIRDDNLTDIEDGYGKRAEFFCQYYRGVGISSNEIKDWLARHVKIFFDYDEWKNYMSQRSFIIGSRFHGNVVAMHAGTPALTLWFDTRTRELAEYLNFPSIPFEDFSENVDPEVYYDLADSSLFEKSYERKYESYLSFLRKNKLKNHLGTTSYEYRIPTFDKFTDRKIFELPFSDKVRLKSECELLLSLSTGALTQTDFRNLFNRLRASRDADTCRLSDKMSASDFPRQLPKF